MPPLQEGGGEPEVAHHQVAHRPERQDHLRHVRQDLRQRAHPREPRAQRPPGRPRPRLRAMRAHILEV